MTWPTGGPQDRTIESIAEQRYFEKKSFIYNVVETSDNTNYYFTQDLIVASSSYLVSIVTMRIGLLRMTIYQNPDFTNFFADATVPTLNLTFNKALHDFFGTSHPSRYSLTI